MGICQMIMESQDTRRLTKRTVACPVQHATRSTVRTPQVHVLGRRFVLIFMCVLVLMTGQAKSAQASEWGCQVMLCLANPGGPTQYAQCRAPIEKLWSALRRGDPFPTCDFGAGSSLGAAAFNTFASAGYCREDLLYWGGSEQSELRCRAGGAVDVTIGGQLYTRVWWDAATVSGTLTEFYGGAHPALAYDPTQSARTFLAHWLRDSDGASGGGA